MAEVPEDRGVVMTTKGWLETTDGIRLEMRVGPEPPESRCGVAVICHPHPLYGGNMDNSVVEALAKGAHDASYLPIRFNFRGTGDSQGVHTGGLREVDDIEAAVAHGRVLAEDASVILMGYSFGAGVAVKWLNAGGQADGFVAVALPSSSDELTFENVPTLIVSGELDDVALAENGIRKADSLGGIHVIVEEEDHFFLEGLDEITEATMGFLELECKPRLGDLEKDGA